MNVVLTDGQQHIVRFDKGEEVIAGIKDFCDEYEIKAGSLSGIGATGGVVLSYYKVSEKEYEDKVCEEELEIVSLSGNISRMGSDVVVHAHGVFSDATMKTYGGHVKKLTVSVTCEVVITTFPGALDRAHDEDTGVNLLVESDGQ
ncbi:MAG: DNA-binding protein [Candidatus Taylorbacteria bacterium]|nr:DNA-binding protein [Candidatus Taylorbacteria bacterium]